IEKRRAEYFDEGCQEGHFIVDKDESCPRLLNSSPSGMIALLSLISDILRVNFRQIHLQAQFVMTLLETLQLIGYSLGAVLPLWMGYLLLRQRLGLVPIQRLLLGLALCMAGWHGSNLVITLRALLGLAVTQRANIF